jgi:thiamine kinase-like enzyme
VVRVALTGPFKQNPAAVNGAEEAVQRLWPGRPAAIAELGGGITNRNFKVDVDGESFVLRMGGARTSLLGIDREVEYEAGERAFEVGIGPEVVAFIPEEGWLVCRFIDGRSIPIEDMRRPETLSRVAAALRRFHDADAIPGRFDAFAVVDDYRAKAEAHGVEIPAAFHEARAMAAEIAAVLHDRPLVPCHNDLLNANFLDDGQVRIVDWEYAGMGDPFFDLANFSVNHDFSVEDDRRLLEAYFGSAGDADLAAVRMMRFMSDFREAMWGVLQSGISDLDFDFMDYARQHFARLAKAGSELGLQA